MLIALDSADIYPLHVNIQATWGNDGEMESKSSKYKKTLAREPTLANMTDFNEDETKLMDDLLKRLLITLSS